MKNLPIKVAFEVNTVLLITIKSLIFYGEWMLLISISIKTINTVTLLAIGVVIVLVITIGL